ncbi:unnamed protein product [Larinioides sclopetarius]|uniref:C2H2-type domain-containing protein n=1 Tax=Larinioides sclopetarius TaxID=280406 RepID=A0AAV2BF65_9ARAC
MTHTNEKSYSCNVCNKKFSQKNTLNVHLRTHTNEKPFSCDLCKVQFSQKCTLNRHFRTHTNEKPYSCDVCNNQFSQKNVIYLNITLYIQMKNPISDEISLKK